MRKEVEVIEHASPEKPVSQLHIAVQLEYISKHSDTSLPVSFSMNRHFPLSEQSAGQLLLMYKHCRATVSQRNHRLGQSLSSLQ